MRIGGFWYLVSRSATEAKTAGASKGSNTWSFGSWSGFGRLTDAVESIKRRCRVQWIGITFSLFSFWLVLTVQFLGHVLILIFIAIRQDHYRLRCTNNGIAGFRTDLNSGGFRWQTRSHLDRIASASTISNSTLSAIHEQIHQTHGLSI